MPDTDLFRLRCSGPRIDPRDLNTARLRLWWLAMVHRIEQEIKRDAEGYLDNGATVLRMPVPHD